MVRLEDKINKQTGLGWGGGRGRAEGKKLEKKEEKTGQGILQKKRFVTKLVQNFKFELSNCD